MLALVKPCILELTDGGPGVGVRLLCFTILTDVPEFIVQRMIPVRMKQLERSNACIGDALVNGGSLKWEDCEQYNA